jgi:DNA invertase Pin-like site-specific DNA recombinase
LGGSLKRQVEATAAYCAKHGLELDETMQDEGLSGYHGRHLKDGALGRFVKRVEAGEIPQGSVLIVEALDRLSRQAPRIAQQQLLALVNAGVEVVTLLDNQRYSQNSLDANMGQLFLSVGMMIGAHAESAIKAKRIADTWTNTRRESANNILPGWFVKTVDGRPVRSVKGAKKAGGVIGIIIDKHKVAIVRRIFRMILELGTRDIAARLNAEGVPTLSTRKTARGFNVWTHETISGLIRGKQVLGLQEVGRMENGKRVLTGETIKAYDAIIDESGWLAANAAIDSRHSGTHTGHNRIAFPNLFGTMAVCGCCQGRLVIRGNGAYAIKYLGCSNASTSYQTKWQKGKPTYAKVPPTCTNRKYYPLTKVEGDVFRVLSNLTWQTEKLDDRAASLAAQLDTIKARMAKRQRNVDAIVADYADAPAALRQSLTKLTTDQEKDEADRTQLERQLAATKSAQPADAQLASVQSLAKRLGRLNGSELAESRKKIAMALPSLLKALTFSPDGQITATLTNGRVIDLTDAWQSVGITENSLVIGKIGAEPRIIGIGYRHPDPEVKSAYRRSKMALDAYRQQRRANPAIKRTIG